MKSILVIKQLKKSYADGHLAVNNLSLEIDSGDIFGFIGHNGAGKTTTLRSIVGALHFEEGEILVDGDSIKTQPVKCKKKIAYLPDNPDLYDYLTGIQYVNFIADMYDVPLNIRQERIKTYSDRLALSDNLNSLISSYSHGMKQKLALISAFVHQPKLLLLDEPFVGLDPEATYIVKGMMLELCKKGSAIFFSTHVLEVAENLCNKIGLINQGELKRVGLTEEVCSGKSLEDVFLEVVGHE